MTRVAFTLIVSTVLLGSFAAVGKTQVRHFEPVTNDELLHPEDPGDWINWRRTLNGQGYSPLDQINRDTVRNLQLVWSWSAPPGTNEVTPLVHDGVMYVPSGTAPSCGTRARRRRPTASRLPTPLPAASISLCRPDPGGVSPGEMPGRCSPTTCSDHPVPARSSRSSRYPRTEAVHAPVDTLAVYSWSPLQLSIRQREHKDVVAAAGPQLRCHRAPARGVPTRTGTRHHILPSVDRIVGRSSEPTTSRRVCLLRRAHRPTSHRRARRAPGSCGDAIVLHPSPHRAP